MKRKKIVAMVAAILIVVVVASILYVETISNNPKVKSIQLPSGEAPQWQIQLAGDVQQERIVTLSDLTQMPLSTVTTADNSTTYIGVSLFDFCNQSRLNWDAGGIQVTGESGNSTTLNLYQAWNSTNSAWYYYKYNVILLAFVKNGAWMTNQTDGGCIQLITPNFNDSYQISEVSKINVEPWTITIKGNVADPITLTATNITLIKSTTINATTYYSGFNSVTANWTGILITDTLTYANVSSYAHQVSLIGIDGKACLGVSVPGNFTFDELNSGKMMIGYQINGKTLTVDQGGPFKSFCPTTATPFRIDTYWMKWLSEIIVY